MPRLTPSTFVLRRLTSDWKLLLTALFGVVLATSLIAGAPVYVKTLERLGLNTAIDDSTPLTLNIRTSADHVALAHGALDRVVASVDDAIQQNIPEIHAWDQRHFKTDDFLLNPTQVIADPSVVLALSKEEARDESEFAGTLGYITNIHDLAENITVLDGRVSTDKIGSDFTSRVLQARRVQGTVAEAVVGRSVAERHGLQVGDSVTFTAALDHPLRVLINIVGVVEPNDPRDEYWLGRADMFFDPPVLESVPEFEVDVDGERRPIAVIITPEAAAALDNELVDPAGYSFSQSFFVNLADLDGHVRLLKGRMATDTIVQGRRGPRVEAVLGAPLGPEYGLDLYDTVALTPYIDERTWVSAIIVGIVERDAQTDEFWMYGPNNLFDLPDPPIPPLPPLPLFVERNVLVDAVGASYPGALATAEWNTFVDKGSLKELSVSDARLALGDLDNQLAKSLPGHQTFTGISSLLSDFERRNFLASIPLLLLLTTMVVAVLYFLSMMVSYLVRSREGDLAALKTRGVDTLHIVRLYGLEGLAVTAVAVVLAPFIAMVATALAGMLPYFSDLTGGELLPVQWKLLPFVAAFGAGVLCLFLLLTPAVLSARAGQLAHSLRSSRPPSVPFFHRYHLDIGLLAIGGLIFWELRSREDLVVGGPFKDVQINEALLLAPVLFLTVVALVFIRFFPLVLRFVSGESAALLHVLLASTAAPLGIALAVRDTLDGNGLAWWVPVGTLAALSVLYWRTQRVRGGWARVVGLALQGLLVWLFVIQEPPVLGTLNVVSTAILASLVPLQLAFLLFRGLSRRSPAWVSLALWSMTRNPLQYTWLVLLLVLVTGLAIFSMTVGATLDRKDEERILYDVAADVRITGNYYADGWRLRDSYVGVPGVSSVSSAYRAAGTGLPGVIPSFRLLAMESETFASMSWYRDDFSTQPLPQVMRELQSESSFGHMAIPLGARGLGVWAKLPELASPVSVQMVVRDGLGAPAVLELGDLSRRDWHLLKAQIPPGLRRPLELISLQVQPTGALVGLPGEILFDDIHAAMFPDGREHLLSGFETRVGWTAISTSMRRSDSVLFTTTDSYRGEFAAYYTFGEEANRGISGVYISPNGGSIPVVVSSSFMGGPENSIGTAFLGSIGEHRVPMVVRDTVEYFPTMDPAGGGFVLADLELLLGHLASVDPEARFTPNEFFISTTPEYGQSGRKEMRRLVPRFADILDAGAERELLTASAGLEPLVTAGWKAMALFSLAIVVFTAGVGYVTYILFFADSSRSETDLVRSLGLQDRQVVGLLALEHLVIVIVGMGLGAWAGLQMSGLTIPAISITDSGGSALPPILVKTEWQVVAVVCSSLVAGFVGMLLLLKRRIFRSELQAISRRVEG